MAAVTICSDFGAPKNKVWHCFHSFPIHFLWSDGTRCHDLSFLNVELFFECWALSQLFHSPLSLPSSFKTIVTLYCNSCWINIYFEKKYQNRKFLCSHFNIKDRRKKQHFQHIKLYYFNKSKSNWSTHIHTHTQKRFVQYIEKVLWLIKHVNSGLESFTLEICHWTMFHSWINQLNLRVIKTRC